MPSRLYHAVVLAGISAVGAGVAHAAYPEAVGSATEPSSDPLAPEGVDSELHTKPGVRGNARFDAAAEADAGWHPTK